MLNHARTLLINAQRVNNQTTPDDDGLVTISGVAEQYIVPEYKTVIDDGPAREVASILFGSSPDRLTLNYRAQQYLALLHADPVAEGYVLRLGSQLTYLNAPSWVDYPFHTRVLTSTGAASPVGIAGQFVGNDQLGQNTAMGDVTLESGDLGGYPEDGGPWATGITGVSWQWRSTPIAGRWVFRAEARPARTVGDIAAQLAAGNSGAVRRLLSQPKPELIAFRELYLYGESVARRLCGALLGLIYTRHWARGGV